MFSVVSVCQSFCPERIPYDNYPWYIGSHCAAPSHSHPLWNGTLLYRETPPDTGLTVQGPPRHRTSLYKYPLVLTFIGHHWRPVQTSSLQDPPTPLLVTSGGHHWDLFKLVHFNTPTTTGVDIWWLLNAHTVGASGRYTSYWNAFLFATDFDYLEEDLDMSFTSVVFKRYVATLLYF